MRTTRFERRLQKTHKRFGYISLEKIVSSYFSFRKETTDFKAIKRVELLPVTEPSKHIPLSRLEQMHRALLKANAVQREKRVAA